MLYYFILYYIILFYVILFYIIFSLTCLAPEIMPPMVPKNISTQS
jgi:hypothetical protein